MQFFAEIRLKLANDETFAIEASSFEDAQEMAFNLAEKRFINGGNLNKESHVIAVYYRVGNSEEDLSWRPWHYVDIQPEHESDRQRLKT